MVDSCLETPRGRPPKSKPRQLIAACVLSGVTLSSSKASSVHEQPAQSPYNLKSTTPCQNFLSDNSPHWTEHSAETDNIKIDCIDEKTCPHDCSTPTPFLSTHETQLHIMPRCLCFDTASSTEQHNITSESQDHTYVEIYSSCPAKTSLHSSTFNDNEFQICTAQGACYQRDRTMSAVSVQTDSVVDESVERTTSFSQTVLDSSSIVTELPDNSEQPFLLDMSNWQRDSTKFGIVFTGPNGETFLPPNSFARLDSYVNQLMQSEYLYLTKNCFTLIQKT